MRVVFPFLYRYFHFYVVQWQERDECNARYIWSQSKVEARHASESHTHARVSRIVCTVCTQALPFATLTVRDPTSIFSWGQLSSEHPRTYIRSDPSSSTSRNRTLRPFNETTIIIIIPPYLFFKFISSLLLLLLLLFLYCFALCSPSAFSKLRICVNIRSGNVGSFTYFFIFNLHNFVIVKKVTKGAKTRLLYVHSRNWFLSEDNYVYHVTLGTAFAQFVFFFLLFFYLLK